VVPPGPLIFLSAWPDDVPFPGTSVLNAPNGGIVANAAVVPSGADGGIKVQGSNPTDLIIDINGYYVVAAESNANPLQIALLRWYGANAAASFSVGLNPQSLAFDGDSMWVAFPGGVDKIRASDGSLLGVFSSGPANGGIAFDGANVWVANTGGNTVTKLRAFDGGALGTFTVGLHPHWHRLRRR